MGQGENTEESTLFLGDELGAEEAAGSSRITLYIPDADKDGNALPDAEDWIRVAMDLLTTMNGGVTRLAPAEGQWKPDEGPVVRERTTVLYSNLMRPSEFRRRLPELREFLHQFGRDTGQGEVMAEFTGEGPDGFFARTYTIRLFDQAAE